MASAANHKNKASPYKMGGPKGVVVFALFFTIYTYYISAKCQSGQWDLLTFDLSVDSFTFGINIKITILILLWFLAQCVFYVSAIGGNQELGVPLQSGRRLQYNANALAVLCMNLILMIVAILTGCDVRYIPCCFVSMFKSSVFLCLTFSVYLYLRGAGASPSDRNPHGCSGYLVYDLFMGRELNPRWRTLDVKYVLFRSCIIGWILLNISSLVECWILYENLNATLLLLNAIQLGYVVDYFLFEGGVIVSRDIVHEGLGYNILIQFIMIPFCFCVQTRYVLSTNTRLPTLNLCLIALFYVLGYYIYRASNSEKNNFRRNPNDPNLKHLRTMSTSSGKKLLISGWWGMCRHPNYLGDLIISLSYALCTGFSHIIPYLGTIFLVLLLLDREKQDNEDCKRKYGADWDKYCDIVKYHIIPGIY